MSYGVVDAVKAGDVNVTEEVVDENAALVPPTVTLVRL